MDKLISFIVPSRNLDTLKTQFENFEKTTADLNAIEFLIKLDTDQAGALEFIEAEVKKRKFTIKYIITPRLEGTFSLWMGIEQLFGMISDESYFVQIMSDEPYYKTHHWDLKLRNYIHLFPDDVFRLRLSSVKFANYASHYECAFRCDSFPIYTRRWLELTEGIGDCWGSDAYQQCITYHLSLGPGGYHNYYRVGSMWRDISILDIDMGGLEFGVGIDPATQRIRHFKNLQEWRRLSSYKMQERFSYLARRMYCYIWAYENCKNTFSLVLNERNKKVLVINEHHKKIFEVSYKLQWLNIMIQNFIRDIKTNYYINSSWRLQKIKFVILAIIQFIKLCRKSLLNACLNLARLLRRMAQSIAKLSYSFLKFLAPEILIKIKKYIYRNHRLTANCISEKALTEYNPPGISVLYNKTCLMLPGVRSPSESDIQFGKKLILSIVEQRNRLRDKLFNNEKKCPTSIDVK